MKPSVDMIIGANIQRRRIEAGISQSELGQECTPPLRAQQISKYEVGIDKARASLLLQFSRVLKCTVLDLFEGTDALIFPGKEMKQGDLALMKNYKSLPVHLQDTVREMVRAIAMDRA